MDKIAVTIDYESDWGGRVESVYAIEKMTDIVLEILDYHQVQSTFFISTKVLDKTKQQILNIYNAGHEIASHGHNHHSSYDTLQKSALEYEIGYSKQSLEDLIAAKVYGFRTPQFRKNQYTEELLLKYQYQYDSSSVNTGFLNRYSKRQNEYGEVINFPVSSLFGKVPAGLKWINFFGIHLDKPTQNYVAVVYLHLFDLLSMRDILALYDKRKISKTVLLFYLLRRGEVLSSLNKISTSSQTLNSLLVTL